MFKRSILGTVVTGIVATLATGGCDTVKAPAAVRPDPLPARAYPKQVAIHGLAQGLASGKPTVTGPTEGEPLRVSVPLRSTADKPLNVQYQFRFFDKNGRPTHQSGWRFLNIPPRVKRVVEANAMDTKAVDWRLEVRPAR